MNTKAEERLEKLEEISKTLEGSRSIHETWLQKVNEYALTFMEQIDEYPVYSDRLPDELNKWNFTDQGKQIDHVLKLLHQEVDTIGINPAAGGHMGYVPGGGVFPTALGDFLAAITNRYAGIYYANPGAVTIEQQCLNWMAELVGFAPSFAGNLSSGGSVATLTAIVAARERHAISPENIRKKVIYLTSQAHHCIKKALRIASMDFAVIREIIMNEDYRMNVQDLNKKLEEDIDKNLEPFIIVGSAGTTDTGIIDPLDEIADIANRRQCWFHVDAAYGGFFKLIPSLQENFRGIERADSVVLDPHKGLFISYGLGAVLIRDRPSTLNAFSYRASYMQDSYGDYDILNPADVSPELTKHFRGLRMWLSLHLLGINAIRSTLEEKLLLAKHFHQEVNKMGYLVGPTPTLSVCLFRKSFGNSTEEDNEINKRIHQSILECGEIYLSTTSIDGVFWLRICVMVFRTHKRHIDKLLKLLENQ